MYKKPLTFDDPFTEESTTEVHYFHLTATELVELDASYPNGLEAELKSVVSKNPAQVIEMFRGIIAKSYGVKDGPRFVKDPIKTQEFMSGQAYDALFLEMMTTPNGATEFVNKVIPAKMLEKATEIQAANTVSATVEQPTKKRPQDMTKAELLAAYQERNEG